MSSMPSLGSLGGQKSNLNGCGRLWIDTLRTSQQPPSDQLIPYHSRKSRNGSTRGYASQPCSSQSGGPRSVAFVRMLGRSILAMGINKDATMGVSENRVQFQFRLRMVTAFYVIFIVKMNICTVIHHHKPCFFLVPDEPNVNKHGHATDINQQESGYDHHLGT